MKKYAFREGHRGLGVTAQVAGVELSRIREHYGRLAPADVVNESRPETAALHPCFTWDDAVAAEKYRQKEAGALIRVVHVVDPDATDQGRAFVNVVAGDDGEHSYEPVDVVVDSPTLYAQAVAIMKRRIAEAQRALADLQRVAQDEKKLRRLSVAMNNVTRELEAIA